MGVERGSGSCLEDQGAMIRGNFFPLTFGQGLELIGTDGGADESEGGMPDGGGHLADLAVATFVEDQFDPSVGYGGPDADGRGAGGIGGAGSSRFARQGRVFFPAMKTPSRSFCRSASSGMFSTWAQ